MNSASVAFFLVTAGALLAVPRKWAPVPLLVSCCYMTIGQGIQLGLFSLPVYRMVLAVGLLRVLLRGERFAGRLNAIDVLMMWMGAWVFTASLFHEWAPGSGPVFASGYIFNIALVYFLTRIWCHDLNGLIDLTRSIALVLVPIATLMVLEHVNEKNLFSMFGGVPEEVYIRDGAIRSQGPFQHPILAGTVGAVCFPLMIGIWRRHRLAALIGSCACVAMIIASGSSGPLMSWFLGMFAVLMWLGRHWLKAVRFAAVPTYVKLELLMSRPAYYMLSKFDLTGSSTGWHRSRLIEATIEHFSEWWLFGTDKTVHWMGISVGWSEQHADITNYYIVFAVLGGLPAILLLVAMMWRAFHWVGEIVRRAPGDLAADGFMLWCFGSALFAHAVTCLSAAYFDQSMIFFWLNIAVISSVQSIVALGRRTEQASPSGIPHRSFFPGGEVRT
jgi:hypothetical protein